jgi:hypothetical protein
MDMVEIERPAMACTEVDLKFLAKFVATMSAGYIKAS